MAVTNSYRDAIGDAAIALLAEEGGRGFTHRAVDRIAGLPEGTTSRYARTRAALLTLACDAMFVSDSDDVVAAADEPQISTASDVADLMTNATVALLQAPDRFRARVELQLESRRTPALRRYFEQARRAFITPLATILEHIGYPNSHIVADRLITAVDGILLRQLIIGADALTHVEMRNVFNGALS